VKYQEPRWYSIVATICVSLGIAGLRLVDDSSAWNQIVDQSIASIPLGQLTRDQGGVRHKPPTSYVWFDVSANSGAAAVSEGETVATDETGQATLALNEGGTVKIMAQSLVELHGPPKTAAAGLLSRLKTFTRPFLGLKPELTKLHVEKGSIELDLKKDSSLDLDVKGKTLHIVPHTEEGGLEVAVNPLDPNAPASLKALSGADLSISDITHGVNASVNEKPLEVAAGKAVWVGENTKTALAETVYRALSPREGESITPKNGANAKADVKFRWDWLGDSKPAPGQGARVEIEVPSTRSSRSKTAKNTCNSRSPAAYTAGESRSKTRPPRAGTKRRGRVSPSISKARLKSSVRSAVTKSPSAAAPKPT
jgi:hypothetical protein